jgi:hypothetical protein
MYALVPSVTSMQVHRRRSRLVRLSPTRPCASVDHATTWQGQCTRDFDCAKWFDASAGRTHTCICQCLVFVDWKNYPQVKLKCFSSQTPNQSLDSCIRHAFFFRYDFGAAIAACLHVTPFNPTNIHARKDPDRHCSCYLVGEVFMMSFVASDAEFAETAIIAFVMSHAVATSKQIALNKFTLRVLYENSRVKSTAVTEGHASPTRH